MQFLFHVVKLTLLLGPCILVSKRALGPHLVRSWDFLGQKLISSAAVAPVTMRFMSQLGWIVS